MAEDFDDPYGMEDKLDGESWDSYEGICQACDTYGPVNDMALCDYCAAKLERDFIRQREWHYSFSAFGLSDEERVKLRAEVIKKYGRKLELLATSAGMNKNKSNARRKKKRK